VKTVGAYVAGLGLSVSPDHGRELLRALHAAGRDDDLVRLLTDTRIPGWAHIVAAGGTFTWETWTPSDLIGDSMSHGRGSGALVAMQEVLLGVKPIPPAAASGATVLDISPPPGRLNVSGKVPTTAGTAAVGWRRAGPTSELALVLPPNASARVHLPASHPRSVSEGGRPVSRVAGVTVLGSRRGRVTLSVAAGSYRFRSAPR
jgi:alpha-L-rhamnosidase